MKRSVPGSDAASDESTLPVRLVVATLNVWTGSSTSKDDPGGAWPERRPALQKIVQLCSADIIGVQEAHPEILAALDEALPTHSRIKGCSTDAGSDVCWTREGTIYYRTRGLTLLEFGTECAGCFPDKPNRRLFWGRFAAGARTILFTTCHMPWQGSASEVLSGMSARFGCSHAVADALLTLSRPGEPAFCVGDFNESFGPPR